MSKKFLTVLIVIGSLFVSVITQASSGSLSSTAELKPTQYTGYVSLQGLSTTKENGTPTSQIASIKATVELWRDSQFVTSSTKESAYTNEVTAIANSTENHSANWEVKARGQVRYTNGTSSTSSHSITKKIVNNCTICPNTHEKEKSDLDQSYSSLLSEYEQALLRLITSKDESYTDYSNQDDFLNVHQDLQSLYFTVLDEIQKGDYKPSLFLSSTQDHGYIIRKKENGNLIILTIKKADEEEQHWSIIDSVNN